MDELHDKRRLEYAPPELNRKRPLWFTCLLIVIWVPSAWMLFIASRVAWFYFWR